MSNPRLENPISYHWFSELFRKWVAELHHIKRYLGHVSLRMAEHYANPRVLHQAGEKPQVACSARVPNGSRRSAAAAR
jgi:hypothetical protein